VSLYNPMRPVQRARGARLWRQIALAVLVLPLVGVGLDAQGTGRLVGTVTTLAGVPIPGVEITVTGDNQTVTVVTAAGGGYRAENLRPGLVTITVGQTDLVFLPAFEVGVVANITIRADLTLRSPDEVAERIWTPVGFIEASPGLAASSFEGPVVEGGALPLGHFLERVPGLTVSRAGGLGQPRTLLMRGVEVGDSFLVTDGVPLEASPQRLDAWDGLSTDGLEVVRGLPSSRRDGELTGIAHRRTRPVGDPAASRLTLDAEGGEVGWRRFGAATTGSSGSYDWSLGGSHAEADNEQPNGDFRQTAVGGTLDLTRGALTAHLMFQGEATDLGSPGPTLLAAPDLDARHERTRIAAGGTFRLRRGARNLHEFRLTATQSGIRSTNPLTSGTTFLQSSTEAALLFELTDAANAGGFRNDLRTAGMTYEWALDIDEFHYMTFGGSIEGESARYSRTNQYDQGRINTALYAEDRIQLFPDLLLTAGARFVKNGPFGFKALPRGALTYELGWGFSARAGGGYGIGTPTLAQRFGETFDWRGTEDLEQAISRTGDAGVFGTMLGNRVRVDVTAFWHEYENLVMRAGLDIPRLETLDEYRRLTLAERQQLEIDVRAGLRMPLNVPVSESRVALVNLPRSHTIGVESTVTAMPIPQLTVEGAYNYTASEVVTGTRLLRPGDRLPGVPEHQGTFTADLRVGQVSVGGTARYVGNRPTPVDFFSQALGRVTVPSYTRYDVRARVGLTDGVSFSIVGENVSDARYQDTFGYPALGRLMRAGVHVAF
jgi:vitamin B12 transporter